jgi:hypothetical protein
MNEKELFQAFERVLNAKTYDNLKNSIIIEDGNGYRLFEKYMIEPENSCYSVHKISLDYTHQISSLKYAVTWATLDHRGSHYEANRILELDRSLSGIDLNIKLYERFDKKAKDPATKFIYFNKLCEDRRKRKIITTEMESYVIATKRWQLAKFSQTPRK